MAIIERGQTYWLHWDQIGRPVMATDASGTVVWAASYLPFGGIDQVSIDAGALVQDIRFPGQWFQAETGLHQNWHRDYDPTTGRYLQADPLGLVDGPSVYGYARQNPVRFTDPTGEYVLFTCAGGAFFNMGAYFLGLAAAGILNTVAAETDCQQGPPFPEDVTIHEVARNLIKAGIKGCLAGTIGILTNPAFGIGAVAGGGVSSFYSGLKTGLK